LSTQEIDIREALRQAIDEEMERDEAVFVIGEEVAEYDGAYKITKGLWKKWGDKRIIDTPIAESGFCGIAIGAAITGLRPIVEFMSFNFSFVAFDQIASRACKLHYMSGGRLKVPIVFRGPNGAAARVSCQHSHNVESLYAQFPGLKIVAPSCAYDAKGLLKSAIRDDNPILFLENELMYGLKEVIPTDEFLVPIGKGKILRAGSDVTLISHSRMILFCMEAADVLAKKGIKVEVIDLRTIKPLDVGMIATSVRKTGRAVIVEEGHKFAGIASEVATEIMEHCFDFLDAPIKRVCQMETPLPYSPPLEEWTIPNTKRILKALDEVLEGR
jgi:pyruvate dehydrogenase E1 component beta subunit